MIGRYRTFGGKRCVCLHGRTVGFFPYLVTVCKLLPVSHRNSRNLHLNHWVMHPVARVKPIYVETSVRNKCLCSFYCALLTLHFSAPIGGHLHVVCNTKNSKVVSVTDPLTYTVSAFEFFCITNHLKMATNRGRNM
jgi:hypothetical protein